MFERFKVLICTQEREQYIKEEKREMKRNHKEEIDCGVLMDGSELTARRRSGRGEETRDFLVVDC